MTLTSFIVGNAEVITIKKYNFSFSLKAIELVVCRLSAIEMK